MKSLLSTFILLLLLLSTKVQIKAQVAINVDGSTPNNSAMLDVKSSERGVLIPRVDYNNRPTNPENGLLLYVISNGPYGNNAFYYFNGISWLKLNEDNSSCQYSLTFEPIDPIIIPRPVTFNKLIYHIKNNYNWDGWEFSQHLSGTWYNSGGTGVAIFSFPKDIEHFCDGVTIYENYVCHPYHDELRTGNNIGEINFGYYYPGNSIYISQNFTIDCFSNFIRINRNEWSDSGGVELVSTDVFVFME